MLLAAAIAMVAPVQVLAQDAPATAKPPGSLSGRVMTDLSMKPIGQAEISIPTLSLSVLSDDKGAFRLLNIPPGIHLVRARRIGFAQFESQIRFVSGDKTDLPIVLPVVTALDSMKVVGETNLPLSYLEHRAAGLGRYITRDQLNQQEGVRLVSILAQMQGLAMIRGRGNQGWAFSKRYASSITSISKKQTSSVVGTDVYVPDNNEARQGLVTGCYARVYLGRLLVNSGTPAEPVDLNQYAPNTIEAVEYFPSASQVPAEYNRLNSNCGVIVLHPRRSN